MLSHLYLCSLNDSSILPFAPTYINAPAANNNQMEVSLKSQISRILNLPTQISLFFLSPSEILENSAKSLSVNHALAQKSINGIYGSPFEFNDVCIFFFNLIIPLKGYYIPSDI